jgi:hypothetical protein
VEEIYIMTAYIKTLWEDEVPATTPVKYAITDDDLTVITDSATIEVVTSIEAGTPLNATNLNHAEDGIEAAQAAADAAQADADAAQADADQGVYCYALRDIPVWVPLNKSTPLTNTEKNYVPIPAKLTGGTLVDISGKCKDASSSGNIVLTVKNGAVNMLSTDITIEVGDTTSRDAAAQPAVGANNGITTDDEIEVAVTSCGVGVTFAGAFLIFRPAGSA